MSFGVSSEMALITVVSDSFVYHPLAPVPVLDHGFNGLQAPLDGHAGAGLVSSAEFFRDLGLVDRDVVDFKDSK